MSKNGMLLSHYLDSEHLPCAREKNIINQFSSAFPPTVLIKAVNDRLIDPVQTQMAYDRLRELGVECVMHAAEGMEHGDAEETILMLDRWGRDIAKTWWERYYKPCLDFCIDKCTA